MCFTKKELEVKNFIEDVFVPEIHRLLCSSNPLHYMRYEGRCCKQIAVLLTYLLEEKLPNYIWTAWESTFLDEFYGLDYQHAWVYGMNKEVWADDIIMDYGKLYRQGEYCFFKKTSNNVYPDNIVYKGEDFPIDKEIVFAKRKNITNFQGKEAFTGLKMEELYQVVMENIKTTVSV